MHPHAQGTSTGANILSVRTEGAGTLSTPTWGACPPSYTGQPDTFVYAVLLLSQADPATGGIPLQDGGLIPLKAASVGPKDKQECCSVTKGTPCCVSCSMWC